MGGMATVGEHLVGVFTVDDLAAWPDDGFRHELIDGAIIVTPSPGLAHQEVVTRLAALLFGANTRRDLRVLAGPFDVELHPNLVVPDLVVVARSRTDPDRMRSAPELVVEVRSPSTARRDETRKRELYEAAGVASYWLIDPLAPRITILELQEGCYQERLVLSGSESGWVHQPFPVRLCPADLSPDAESLRQ